MSANRTAADVLRMTLADLPDGLSDARRRRDAAQVLLYDETVCRQAYVEHFRAEENRLQAEEVRHEAAGHQAASAAVLGVGDHDAVTKATDAAAQAFTDRHLVASLRRTWQAQSSGCPCGRLPHVSPAMNVHALFRARLDEESAALRKSLPPLPRSSRVGPFEEDLQGPDAPGEAVVEATQVRADGLVAEDGRVAEAGESLPDLGEQVSDVITHSAAPSGPTVRIFVDGRVVAEAVASLRPLQPDQRPHQRHDQGADEGLGVVDVDRGSLVPYLVDGGSGDGEPLDALDLDADVHDDSPSVGGADTPTVGSADGVAEPSSVTPSATTPSADEVIARLQRLVDLRDLGIAVSALNRLGHRDLAMALLERGPGGAA